MREVLDSLYCNQEQETGEDARQVEEEKILESRLTFIAAVQTVLRMLSTVGKGNKVHSYPGMNFIVLGMY